MDGIQQWIAQQWDAVVGVLAIDPARLGEPEIMVRIGLQVLLLFGSAFFSGSETALFSLSRLDLQKLRRERNRYSETLHALLDQPRRLIISILCGNELINIAAAANMTAILVNLYGEGDAGWINVLIMVPLLLLFGEVTPKTIAVSNPVRISTGVVAAPMSLWVQLVSPLRWAIRSIADRVTTLIVGEQKAAENILQVDEFRTLVEEVAKEGELNAVERALIYNLLEAGDTEIVEIMTPRTRTAFLNAKTSVPEIVEQFKAYHYPRVPVFRVHRDNLVGFVHAEDILNLILKNKDLATVKKKDIFRPPVVVPLTKKVDEMFEFFQKHNARAAAVLNEFGGVEGFITMEDVVRFVFGDIYGQAKGEEHYHERDENLYEVPGDMQLNDFNNLTNFGIEDPRMTTIGGVAFRHLDRLPTVGDRIIVEGVAITILEMDEHRIARVRVARGGADEKYVEELEALSTPGLVPEMVSTSEPQPARETDQVAPAQAPEPTRETEEGEAIAATVADSAPEMYDEETDKSEEAATEFEELQGATPVPDQVPDDDEKVARLQHPLTRDADEHPDLETGEEEPSERSAKKLALDAATSQSEPLVAEEIEDGGAEPSREIVGSTINDDGNTAPVEAQAADHTPSETMHWTPPVATELDIPPHDSDQVDESEEQAEESVDTYDRDHRMRERH